MIILVVAIRYITRQIEKKKSKQTKKSVGENAFEQSLLRYLNHKNENRCYMISGKWGSGKTHMLWAFRDKYFKNSEVPFYDISCIGLTTKKDVVTEINKVIESKDESIRKHILIVVGAIPIVGELLKNLLKKQYNYMTAKNGSIFVFDDFERLVSYTSESIIASDSRPRNNQYYSQTQSSKGDPLVVVGMNEIVNELIDIKKHQINVEVKNETDKYLLIIGVINEMLESGNDYKVIIICNTDMIGKRFVSDTLKAKLNCIEYKKKTQKDAARNLANRIIDGYVVEDRIKRNNIEPKLP